MLFCDICKFDDILDFEKDQIIKFLDDVFRNFDKFCNSCGALKIETVGKTYMAAAGLLSCDQELNFSNEINPV